MLLEYIVGNIVPNDILWCQLFTIIWRLALSQDVCSYTHDIHLLIDYPAKGLCIKLSSFETIKDFVSLAFLVVNYFQLHQIAHNVYITRAKLKPNDESYNDIRIYIWARKSVVGVKDTVAFTPAVCELFGHLSIRGKKVTCVQYIFLFHWNTIIYKYVIFLDKNVYDTLKEDDVIDALNDITEESFWSIQGELRHFLEGHLKKNISENSKKW